MKGKIYIISGLSGSGKTVLVEYILKHRENTVRAISYTTRPQRPDEKDGVDYHFITRKHFLKKVEEGEFLEFSDVYGNLYGTGISSFKPTEEGLDVIHTIDVQGAWKLKQTGITATYIFLKVTKNTMRKRLQERGEESLQRRMDEVPEELKAAKWFDHVVSTGGSEKMIGKNAEKIMKFMR